MSDEAWTEKHKEALFVLAYSPVEFDIAARAALERIAALEAENAELKASAREVAELHQPALLQEMAAAQRLAALEVELQQARARIAALTILASEKAEYDGSQS